MKNDKYIYIKIGYIKKKGGRNIFPIYIFYSHIKPDFLDMYPQFDFSKYLQ